VAAWLGLVLLAVPAVGLADVTAQVGDLRAYEVQPLNEASNRRGDTPALVATDQGPKRGRGQLRPVGGIAGGDSFDPPPMPDPDSEDDTSGGAMLGRKWDPSGEDDMLTLDEKGSAAWDPKVAYDFLNPANYQVRSKPAPCPNLTATTTMPLGTGLGGCDPALSAAECSLFKLGMKALSLDQQCFALANQWSSELASINRKSNATEPKCEALNTKYKLGIYHKCCYDVWNQGCAFITVPQLKGSQCRQFKPPRQGSAQECHYAEKYGLRRKAGEEKVGYTNGFKTVQNDVYTDFVRCSKWENVHHIATIMRSDQIGFKQGERMPWRPYAPGVPDPFPKIQAEQSGYKGPTLLKDVDETLAELGEGGFYDVANDHRGDTGLERHKARALRKFLTTVYVTTRAKKELKCSFCKFNEQEYVELIAAQRAYMLAKEGRDETGTKVTDVGENTNASTAITGVLQRLATQLTPVTLANLGSHIDPVEEGVCKAKERYVCKAKKTLRCEKVCFLMGYRGRLTTGETPWKQAFTKRNCPAGTIVKRNAMKGTKKSNATDYKMEVSANVILRTRRDVPVSQKVTTQHMNQSIMHLPPVIREEVMGQFYDTEDEAAELCCFPGCRIPTRDQHGMDNPWYWYDSQTSLQEAASMEVAHTF